jgi:large subunit ribosomal protein L24
MAFKLTRGMEVIIMTGKDRNKTGKVLRIDRRKGRVIVEGINVSKKAIRPNQQNPSGGFIESPAPVAISNVSAIDPDSGGRTRVGFSEIAGQKTRIARRSGKIVEAKDGAEA